MASSAENKAILIYSGCRLIWLCFVPFVTTSYLFLPMVLGLLWFSVGSSGPSGAVVPAAVILTCWIMALPSMIISIWFCTKSLRQKRPLSKRAIDVEKLSELLKGAYPVYQLTKPEEKDRIIRIIFSELTLSENTLQYKCKNGFQALESRFVASSDLTGWLSELVNHREHIATSIRELEAIMPK